MSYFDAGRTLADRFRNHGGSHTHLYGYAMRGMADDWEAGGPVRDVCAGYEEAPEGASIQLRLLAGVFRLVLTGRVPELVRFYPCLGGEDPPAAAWPVMRNVIGEHVSELHDALTTVPQTNEVGRSAALLAGLFDLVDASTISRIRLLELGASAGLNLLVDAYELSGDGWRWGTPGSSVQLSDAITGPVVPRPFTIVERRGCDLDPVDVTTAEGRLLLTSFVWPFDVERHQRLAAALGLARKSPAPVDRASASDWLPRQLGVTTDDGVLTVVWQSITQLYWPTEEIDVVQSVLNAHGADHALGQVLMEYAPHAPRDSKPEVSTTLWPPGRAPRVRHRVLGTAHDHGIPVRLAGPR